LVAYTVKSGLFITVEFQSVWKLLLGSFPNNWNSVNCNSIPEIVALIHIPI
jgi:hypothetical protein